jgi:hypothetical protein
MTRALHRWTPPQRPSPNLSIRTCCKCSLVMHSRHAWAWEDGSSRSSAHWKEYFTMDAPDVRLTKMPECVREPFDKGSGEKVE